MCVSALYIRPALRVRCDGARAVLGSRLGMGKGQCNGIAYATIENG